MILQSELMMPAKRVPLSRIAIQLVQKSTLPGTRRDGVNDIAIEKAAGTGTIAESIERDRGCACKDQRLAQGSREAKRLARIDRLQRPRPIALILALAQVTALYHFEAAERLDLPDRLANEARSRFKSDLVRVAASRKVFNGTYEHVIACTVTPCLFRGIAED